MSLVPAGRVFGLVSVRCVTCSPSRRSRSSPRTGTAVSALVHQHALSGSRRLM